MQDNPDINTDNYWANLDITQAEQKIQELFKVAVREKNMLGEIKISDDCDIECIPDN